MIFFFKKYFRTEEMIFLLKNWFSYRRNDFLTEEINNLDNGEEEMEMVMKVTNIYKHEK